MAEQEKSDPLASLLGDAYTKLDPPAKAVAAGSFLKSRDEADKAARGEASKRSESQIISEFGPSLYSKPIEEFKPSQETAAGFAALSSLMMVAGSLFGGGGRLAGIGAMNNIAGMIKGYQSGRKDLYEQERQQFEENMKVQERNRADIKEAFNLALKMAPTNLRGAEEFMSKVFMSKGMNIPHEMIKTSGFTHTAGVRLGAVDRADNITKLIADSLGFKGVTSRKDLEARIQAQTAGTASQAAAEEAALKKRKELATTQLEEQKLAGGGLTAAERKAETDREDLAKALKADFDRTKQEPIIKDEKLLGAYKKLFPEAPYRTSEKQLTDTDVMSDTAIASRVDRYLAGDKTAGSRFGLSTLGQKNQNKFEEALAQEMKSRGISGQQLAVKMAEYEGIKAEERALGTRTAYIELASQELNKLIPTLEQASANVPRGSFIPVNRLLQTGEASLSEPSLIKLRTAINGVKQAYVKALTPIGTPTDYLRRSADDLFGPAVDNEGIKAALDQMKIEVNAALTAPDAVKESIIRRYSGGSSVVTPAAPAPAAPSVGGAKTLPAEAVAKLKEGVHTKFSNGETWTLTNGVPTQVQ